MKLYYKVNRDKIKARAAKWNRDNRVRRNAQARRRRALRPKKIRVCTAGCGRSCEERSAFFYRTNGHRIQPCKQCLKTLRNAWAAKNRKLVNQRQVAYRNSIQGRQAINRNRQRPQSRIAHSLRQRLRDVVKGAKSDHTLKLLGCDMQFFMRYLQDRFTGAIVWNNYGQLWEIDHILPCALFDLTKPSEQRRCFNYTNLQPLLTEKNRKKSDSVLPVFQAELI